MDLGFETEHPFDEEPEQKRAKDVFSADAARYRWIRENISTDLEWYLLGMHGMGAEGLDAAIDAAIIKAANAKLTSGAHYAPKPE